jgi:hypothetical protein
MRNIVNEDGEIIAKATKDEKSTPRHPSGWRGFYFNRGSNSGY